MATTRPYLLSPVKSNLLLRSIPLLLRFQNSISSHASLISISKNRASNFPRSCNIDTPISNETRVFHESRFRLVGQREFVTRATNVSDAGSIDTPLIQSMEKKIKEKLNAESVCVQDTSGDGRHVCINVVSSAFEGQSAVNRQRMVYKAIWEELQNAVHAVDQMTTKTPGEAAGGGGQD